MKTIRHVGLIVENAEKALILYRDCLGFFPEIDQIESGVFFENLVGIKEAIARTIKCHNKETGDCIELIEYQQPEAIKRSKSINSLGFNHLALNIKEIDNLYLEIKNLGLEFITKPEYSPNGKVKVAFCRDFEGNLLELVEEVA